MGIFLPGHYAAGVFMLGILYSFRRCPYAMRARLALAYCVEPEQFELREVVLKDKPQAMLDISPKATVPVLQLTDDKVLEESLDIMQFALSKAPELSPTLYPNHLQHDINELIEFNDGPFKWALDRYKYADRYEESEAFYREQGEVFLTRLNERLEHSPFLIGDEVTLADLAIFPFVRQFAHVNKAWFEASPYTHLQTWLGHWLESPLFIRIMKKYTQWAVENEPVYFP
jgi:glutathione S-transferase